MNKGSVNAVRGFQKPPRSIIFHMFSFLAHLECENTCSRFLNGFCQLYVTTPNFIQPPVCPSVGPSIQTYNLSFRVCVMCLRTTTESRGGNRLALCCNPTLTWYDPAPSLFYIHWGWRTANCTSPLPEPITCTCAILNQPFIRLRKGRSFNYKQKQQ